MTKTNAENTYGVGLELEGFIVNGERAKERIEDLPASEWLMKKALRQMPALAGYLSFEQASVMLEIKTDVFPCPAEAVRQVLEIRAQVNCLLQEAGCHLVFQPVLTDEFEFVPATTDANSRTHQLIGEWGQTAAGMQMLYATVIASLQINDSRPFRNVLNGQDRLERARQIHNEYSARFEDLAATNRSARDARGRTHMENLLFLLPAVKEKAFNKRGFEDPRLVVLPGHFDDIETMQRWMCAHSDVDDFAQASCKNEHAVTVKVKREKSVWIAESRVYDSADSKEYIDKIVDLNTKLLRPFITNS